jgi:dCTP deaminase
MSVLCDWEIRTLCNGGGAVSPFSMEFINPASIDVRLGKNLMIETPHEADLELIDISEYTKENPYLLHPGEFVLAETVEKFRIPDRISAQFVLKSSRAREGYQHLLAGWIDPGYRGRLTLEIKNIRRYHAIPLYKNMRIGQIVFHHMSQVPVKSYAETGHYLDHDRVMPSVA